MCSIIVYQSQFNANEQISLGTFGLASDAAWAYDYEARKASGKKRLTNFSTAADFEAARNSELASSATAFEKPVPELSSSYFTTLAPLPPPRRLASLPPRAASLGRARESGNRERQGVALSQEGAVEEQEDREELVRQNLLLRR